MQTTRVARTAGLPTGEPTTTETLRGLEYWCAPEQPARVPNVLTIDLEDWPIAVLGPEHEVSNRVVENTKRCLQILQWHHVKATFFILGRVAERFADLVREVHDAGHEVASHGYAHELLTRMTPARFEEDTLRSVDILTDLTGERPIGYRAPAFSIVESTRWAGPILADLGFKYSSSIFPITHRRYGIPGAPRHMHRWHDCQLIECPPATATCLGRNWPVAGGGYSRLLPGWVTRYAVRRINRDDTPAVLYMHPYELDVRGISHHKRQGVRVSPWRHVTQALFRSRTEKRLHRLLETFRFTTMRDLLKYAV
jgi:polysaccharide deacetylase family protein (PEP-CTERM system associated)